MRRSSIKSELERKVLYMESVVPRFTHYDKDEVLGKPFTRKDYLSFLEKLKDVVSLIGKSIDEVKK